jgi:outer membrane protein insertion porin family
VRLSAFDDSGQVSDNFDFQETRVSAGLALSWYSPVGPIKISFARAVRRQPEDRTQAFQFSLGTVF